MLRAALALLLTLTAVRAHADTCGESELSQEALDAIGRAQDREDADKADESVLYRVPVHVHVVRRAPQGEGDMPVVHARAITTDVLTREFAARNIPFAFDLASIDYTTADADTYHLKQNSDEEKTLYDDVNKGGRRDLNIYIVGPRSDTTVNGWAEFLFNPALLRGDHVVLRYYPTKQNFGDPLTVVHEVGHWLGLLHTFQFGCGSLAHGDLISDTPTQKSGHASCALTSDTCPDDEGSDPVDNIMGYSHACRGTFTAGQIKRMKYLWRTARGGKGDDLVPEETVVTDDAAGGCRTTGHGSLGLTLLVALGLVRRRRAVT